MEAAFTKIWGWSVWVLLHVYMQPTRRDFQRIWKGEVPVVVNKSPKEAVCNNIYKCCKLFVNRSLNRKQITCVVWGFCRQIAKCEAVYMCGKRILSTDQIWGSSRVKLEDFFFKLPLVPNTRVSMPNMKFKFEFGIFIFGCGKWKSQLALTQNTFPYFEN